MSGLRHWLSVLFSRLGVPPPLDLPPRLARDRTLERIRPVVERELDRAEEQLLLLGLQLDVVAGAEDEEPVK